MTMTVMLYLSVWYFAAKMYSVVHEKVECACFK